MNPLLSQVAQIRWDLQQTVLAADGACEHVLGEAEQGLKGRTLREILGIGKERAKELELGPQERKPRVEFVHGVLKNKPRVFRLVMVSREESDEVEACVMDLEDVLHKAPPVQISRLSSSLSHEIRNPLSSVKMAVQTLARNPGLSERDQRRLAIANREVRTMERMLWLLSEYGRDNSPQLETLPLRALVHEASTLVGPELAERKVLLRIDEPQEAPKARVDTARMRPVLAQLLLNVATGNAEGSTVVALLRSLPGGGSQLVLDDPSAVLPPEEKASVFEPFGSMLARGAGLSLAALYQVMKSHGGNVTAEAITPGTRYTLTFLPA
jgi:two-component system sensor histidine kinase HydH